MTSTAFAEINTIYVNGIPAQFETENIGGYTYVDYKLFCTAINAPYAYKAEEGKITVVRDGYVLDMFVGSGDIRMNGETVSTEAMPYIDDSVMVPLANLCRGIGMTVYYDEKRDKIIVNKTDRGAGTERDEMMTKDSAPVIDFTDKSEDMKALHIETRREFSRSALPLYFMEDEDAADLLRSNASSLVKSIDALWSNAAITSIIGYGVDTGYDFGDSADGDYLKIINQYSLDFSLEPYDSYTLSREIFPDGRYLLLVEYADLDAAGADVYTMIFLDGDEVSYYTMEKADSGYRLIRVNLDDDGELVYTDLGEIEKSKLKMIEYINADIA